MNSVLRNLRRVAMHRQPRLLIFAFCFAVSYLAAKPSGDLSSHYTVTLPKEVSLDKVQMYYVLKRHDGRSYTEDLAEAKSVKDHGFVFPTRAGDHLEAIFYCPGYQFATVDVASIGPVAARASLVLKRLSTVTLRGKSPPIPATKEYAHLKFTVKIYYEGSVGFVRAKFPLGGCPFFIAEAPVAADGTFTAQMPDLYRDPLIAKEESRALGLRVESTSASPLIGVVSYGLKLKGHRAFGIEEKYSDTNEFVEASGEPVDGAPLAH